MFFVKIILNLLLLLSFFSCSQKEESNEKITYIDNLPPELINYTIDDVKLSFNKEEIVTNQNNISFTINSNLSFSKILLYDTDCNNLLKEENFINNKIIILSEYELNQKTNIFYKINLNNQISKCMNSSMIINHDNQKPSYPEISQYIDNNFNGKIVSNNIIKLGGDLADISEDTSKIILSKDFQGEEIIGEYEINEYVEKEIILKLLENSFNFIYLKSVDYHNNYSETNPYAIIIEHKQSSNIINKPILAKSIEKLNNKYTSSVIFNFKGFLDFNSDKVNIYSDENRINLLKQVSKNTFLDQGVNVQLKENTLNEFWISASNNTYESELLIFKINHSDSAPEKPILDQSILDSHNNIIDIVNAPIFGYVPESIEFIFVYNNPELIGDPIFTINRNDFINNTGIPLALEFGNNYLYFTAIDFNNLKSPYQYIQVFVEE